MIVSKVGKVRKDFTAVLTFPTNAALRYQGIHVTPLLSTRPALLSTTLLTLLTLLYA